MIREKVVLEDPAQIFRGEFADTKLSNAVVEPTQKGSYTYGDGKGHKVMRGNLLTHLFNGLSADQRTKLKIKKQTEQGQEYIVVEDEAVFAKITYGRDTQGKVSVKAA